MEVIIQDSQGNFPGDSARRVNLLKDDGSRTISPTTRCMRGSIASFMFKGRQDTAKVRSVQLEVFLLSQWSLIRYHSHSCTKQVIEKG